MVMGGVYTALFLASLDQTVVATALPRMAAEFGGVERVSWVVTAYLLASTVTIPLYGSLSDRFGRRTMFATSLAIFLVASAAAGTSGSMTQLVVWRGLQGLGAGGIVPLSMALMGDIISPRDRGRWTGIGSAVIALSSVLGPAVGGTLTDHASWRWIFYLNVPLSAIAIVVVVRALDLPFARRAHRIDFVGAGLLCGGVSALLLASVWGGTTLPWRSIEIRGFIVAGIALLGLFVLAERRAAEPVLPFSLFRNRTVSVASAAIFLTGACMMGTVVFIPLFLQGVVGLNATESGAVMIPFMLGLVVTNVTSGQLVSRTGRYKAFPLIGASLLVLGSWLLAQMGPSATRAEVVRNMVVMGLGVGAIMPVLMIATQNAVGSAQLGVATGFLNFSRSIGTMVGVAGFGAVLAQRSHSLLGGGGTANPRALLEPAALRSLDPGTIESMRGALAASLHAVFIVALPLSVVLLLLTALLKELPLRTTVNVDAPPPDEALNVIS